MTKIDELNTSTRILMGPGPSDVHPRVLKAMATPLIGHLDPEFLVIMDDIKNGYLTAERAQEVYGFDASVQ